MQLNKKEIAILLGKAALAVCIRSLLFFYDTPSTTIPGHHTIPYHTVNTSISNNTNTVPKESIEINIILDAKRTPTEQEEIRQSVKTTISKLADIMGEEQQLNKAIDSITIHKKKGTSRGYSSHHNIVINYGDMSAEEFNQVLIHELGHVIDLGLIEGESGERNNQFSEFGEFVFAEDDRSILFYSLSRESEKKRKTSSKKIDFCSSYGMTNPFEDFAECLNLYLYHHNYFLSLTDNNPIIEKKYNFLASLFGNEYISGGLDLYTKNEDERYRDTTRIEKGKY